MGDPRKIPCLHCYLMATIEEHAIRSGYAAEGAQCIHYEEILGAIADVVAELLAAIPPEAGKQLMRDFVNQALNKIISRRASGDHLGNKHKVAEVTPRMHN